MAVAQSWKHHFALGIDDARARSNQGGNDFIFSDSDQTLPAHGQGLGGGKICIHRQNMGVGNDEVGGGLTSRHCHAGEQEDCPDFWPCFHKPRLTERPNRFKLCRNMRRIVQLTHAKHGRRVALAEENALYLLTGETSAYGFARKALTEGKSLIQTLSEARSAEQINYDPIYRGESAWKLLPAFDHPSEPARCLVTGTGLTHKASAENRQSMHASQNQPLTDSMRMYQSGLEGGRPEKGTIGAQPEWFYKGCSTILRAHGESLTVPNFGLDGGEEAEVAGIYIIDDEGRPRRVGLTLANEFSDHKWEAKNYLWLAHSKLRTCALGPELIVQADFSGSTGRVRIERSGRTLWERAFATGQKYMSHTLANLEHHHFKYDAHRRPGDAHIHFFGADVFSFGEGIALADGDVMEIQLTGFGRALRNPIHIDTTPPSLVPVEPL